MDRFSLPIDAALTPLIPTRCTSSDVPMLEFIKEFLRRTKISYSVLMAALIYLLKFRQNLLKATITEKINEEVNGLKSKSRTRNRNIKDLATFTQAQSFPITPPASPMLQNTIPILYKLSERCTIQLNSLQTCKRIFMIAVMTASKVIYDQHSSNLAWAKFSGLSNNEINDYELLFLQILDYKLFIPVNTFQYWSCLLTHSCIIYDSKLAAMLSIDSYCRSMKYHPCLLVNICQNESDLDLRLAS
jgi:hypothetical protein